MIVYTYRQKEASILNKKRIVLERIGNRYTVKREGEGRMKKKRSMAAILAAVMGVSLIAGCGQPKEETAQSSLAETAGEAAEQTEVKGTEAAGEETAEKEQVTIQFWHQGTSQTDTEFVQKCIESFEKKYPHIKVEATGMSSTISDQETKLNAAVLSDTYPDVIQLVLAEVGSRGALGDFEKLDTYIDKWAEKDDLFDSAYEMGKYQGEQVALGIFPNPQIYTFREDKFLEAGLDPENPPSDWEGMKKAAEALTERDGDKVVFAGMDLPSVDSSLVFTEPYMRSAGSQVIDELNLKPAFTDQGAVDAFTFLGELASMNVSIPHDQQKGDERPFMKNMAAISNLTPQQITQYKENNPDVPLGYLPVPSKDGSEPGTSFCGYNLIAMGATSKHKEEAWLFMEHLLSNEIVWMRTEDFKVPIVKKSLEEQFIQSGDPELNTAVIEYVEQGKGKATVPWVSVYNKYVSVAYEEVINQKKTPEQALGDAMAQLEKEIQ